MRTGRSLTVCWSLLPGGGVWSGGSGLGGCLLWGVSGPGVCVWSGGCLLPGGLVPGGVWSRGVSGPGGCVWCGGCLLLGGLVLGGVCSCGGLLRGGISQHALRQTPPVDRHTPVKILPWPNFIAAGNNNSKLTQFNLRLHKIMTTKKYSSRMRTDSHSGHQGVGDRYSPLDTLPPSIPYPLDTLPLEGTCRVPTFPDSQNSLTFPVFFFQFSSIFLVFCFLSWKLDPF